MQDLRSFHLLVFSRQEEEEEEEEEWSGGVLLLFVLRVNEDQLENLVTDGLQHG